MPWFPTETLGGKTLILNLLHRPETLENFHLFRWQQDLAHRVGLKVTIMLDGANLERPEVIAATLKDIRQFGDDVGIWLNPSSETRLAGVNNGGEEPFCGCSAKPKNAACSSPCTRVLSAPLVLNRVVLARITSIRPA